MLRNLTGVNGLKDLLKEHLMPQEFHVPASRGYGKRNSRHSQSFFFVINFFQNHGGLIAALNRKNQYLIIILIIIIVIIEHLFI